MPNISGGGLHRHNTKVPKVSQLLQLSSIDLSLCLISWSAYVTPTAAHRPSTTLIRYSDFSSLILSIFTFKNTIYVVPALLRRQLYTGLILPLGSRSYASSLILSSLGYIVYHTYVSPAAWNRPHAVVHRLTCIPGSWQVDTSCSTLTASTVIFRIVYRGISRFSAPPNRRLFMELPRVRHQLDIREGKLHKTDGIRIPAKNTIYRG